MRFQYIIGNRCFVWMSNVHHVLYNSHMLNISLFGRLNYRVGSRYHRLCIIIFFALYFRMKSIILKTGSVVNSAENCITLNEQSPAGEIHVIQMLQMTFRLLSISSLSYASMQFIVWCFFFSIWRWVLNKFSFPFHVSFTVCIHFLLYTPEKKSKR